jgi:hypothetical protein
MATTTPNFGWSVPTSTDLVKDGATAIETLGDAIDASLLDLKGGTTGQVLAKNSNTDMDFTWTAIDPLVILDAKGDLITATAADTPARLAVGTNGQVLTADSTAGTGLAWATPSSGGMTLISTTTLSGASVTLSSIPQTYNHLQLVIKNYKPATDATSIFCRPNNDTGTNYVYDLTGTGIDKTFTDVYFSINRGADNTVATNLSVVNFYDYTNTTTWKIIDVRSAAVSATTNTNVNYQFYQGISNQTAAISSLVLAPTSGNFTSGTALLYGVK